jgi:HEAT repeat protein
MRYILLASTLFCASLQADDQQAKRISALCVIGDYQAACAEGKIAYSQNPRDKKTWDAYLRALSAAGHEKEMISLYQENHKSFALSDEEFREALEVVAWGVLNKASTSPSPLVRVLGMIAAFMTQDARGVAIISKQFNDPNAVIRAAAIEISGELRDEKLQIGVLNAAQNDRNWEVRVAAVRSIGKMGIKKGRPLLVSLLDNPRSTIEERLAACESIVNLTDSANADDVKKLVDSNRAGLRQLACRIAAHFKVTESTSVMVSLLKDAHADVRASALVALGIFDRPSVDVLEAIEKAFDDPDPEVKIAAAWALTRQAPAKGQNLFRKFFQIATTDQKRRASAALAGCGPCSLPLAEQLFAQSNDPYISMNLALGLIGQRRNVKPALSLLANYVVQHEDRWMYLENGYYKALMPSKITHSPAIPQRPESVNQTTRLEILNILAMLEYPNIQSVMKNYLQKRPWGISGNATALMLTEGDETAIIAVEALLDDPSIRIRMQAALILSLWGRSPKAIKTLEQCYAAAERDEKEKILEGLGRIGDASSIPFLTERLNELNQSFRIIAATALLQCLYH